MPEWRALLPHLLKIRALWLLGAHSKTTFFCIKVNNFAIFEGRFFQKGVRFNTPNPPLAMGRARLGQARAKYLKSLWAGLL